MASTICAFPPLLDDAPEDGLSAFLRGISIRMNRHGILYIFRHIRVPLYFVFSYTVSRT